MIETAYGPNPNPLAQAPAVKPVAMPPMQRTLRVPNDRARGAFVENVFRPCDRRLLLRLLPQKRLEATFKGCAARLKRTLEAIVHRCRRSVLNRSGILFVAFRCRGDYAFRLPRRGPQHRARRGRESSCPRRTVSSCLAASPMSPTLMT